MITEDIIRDLKKLGDTFGFSNLDENHELFSNKIEKMVGKYKLETPTKIWIVEFFCLRSKKFLFNCGDISKNKLKSISKSQSKHIKLEGYKKCLNGEECQRECDNYVLRSINHEMYLQEVKKSTFSIFDDKRK